MKNCSLFLSWNHAPSKLLRDNIGALRGNIGALRDNIGALRDNIGGLRGNIGALSVMFINYQESLSTECGNLHRNGNI
jgi:hypothetical protein